MQSNSLLCAASLLISLVADLKKEMEKKRANQQRTQRGRRQPLSLKMVTMETVPFFPLLWSIWSRAFLCNSGYKLAPPPPLYSSIPAWSRHSETITVNPVRVAHTSVLSLAESINQQRWTNQGPSQVAESHQRQPFPRDSTALFGASSPLCMNESPRQTVNVPGEEPWREGGCHLLAASETVFFTYLEIIQIHTAVTLTLYIRLRSKLAGFLSVKARCVIAQIFGACCVTPFKTLAKFHNVRFLLGSLSSFLRWPLVRFLPQAASMWIICFIPLHILLFTSSLCCIAFSLPPSLPCPSFAPSLSSSHISPPPQHLWLISPGCRAVFRWVPICGLLTKKSCGTIEIPAVTEASLTAEASGGCSC